MQGGVTLLFYECDTCWGAMVPYIGTPITLDNDPATRVVVGERPGAL